MHHRSSHPRQGQAMNLLQKIAALFGVQYVATVWQDTAYVRRAQQVSKGVWVITADNCRIFPGGRIAKTGARWEPLTPKIKKFFDTETA